MLENFYGVHNNLLEVKEADTLNIGKRTLHFYMVPMLHWPETMGDLPAGRKHRFQR